MSAEASEILRAAVRARDKRDGFVARVRATLTTVIFALVRAGREPVPVEAIAMLLQHVMELLDQLDANSDEHMATLRRFAEAAPPAVECHRSGDSVH